MAGRRKPRFEKGRSNTHSDLTVRTKARSEDFLYDLIDERGEKTLVLILDCITDPHNLGACLRTADGAGVDAVIAPKDKSVSLNDTVRRVSCGGAENVPFVTVTNLARTMERLQEKGIWFVGTADEVEQTIYEIDLTGPIGIVMGAEGSGMRRLTREHCDFLVQIPMSGKVDCLNVSVATGVTLYETVRQRLTKSRDSS